MTLFNAHYSDVYSHDLQGFNMLYVINETLDYDYIKNIHSYHVDRWLAILNLLIPNPREIVSYHQQSR